MPERPDAATAAPGSRRTRRRIWIALVALALLIGLRAGLPEALRRIIEQQASQALGRRVAVADVDLGLLTGRATLEGLSIGGADLAAPIDPAAALVRCTSASAQVAWLPLVTGKIRVREIALLEPSLRLERAADGSLTPIVLAPAAPEEPPAEPEAESDLDLVIERIALDRAELKLVRQRDAAQVAQLRFENLSLGDLSLQHGAIGIGAVALRGPELQVQAETLSEDAEAGPAPPAPDAQAAAPEPAPAATRSARSGPRVSDLHIERARFLYRLPDGEAVEAELELRARDAGTSGAPFPLEITLTTEKASMALEGQLGIAPLSFEGKLRWEGIRLDRLSRVIEKPPVVISTGQMDGDLEIALRVEAGAGQTPPGVRVKGTARIYHLDVEDPAGAYHVIWKQLAVELTELSLPLGEEPAGGLAVHLAKVALDGPVIEFVRSAPPASAEPAAATSGEAPAAQASDDASPAPQFAIDALEVNGGSLQFRDQVIQPVVETKLRELRIRARDIRWPERDLGSLRVTAKAPQGGSLDLKGAFANGVGSLDLDLKQLPLTTYDPYAGGATGLKIDAGRLSLAGKIGLRKNGFDAKTRVSLHQLAIVERESGWFQKSFGVPVDVALALLRDLQGDITLPIDVEQSKSGTSIGIASAVASALRQAVVGALASPLKLLGGVADAAGSALSSGLAPIPMEPGRAELATAAHERVAKLAKLLASRPGLQVALRGSAGEQDDAELARREVIALAKSEQPLPGEDELGFFEKRRVRAALADADAEDPGALDAETAAALTRLAATVQVTEESRKTLALARAEAVASALKQEHGAPAEAVAGVEAVSGPAQVALELRSR